MESIIFDVDGTLWDTTEVVAEAWNKAVRKSGIKAEHITADILKREFGKPMNVIADHLFPGTSGETKDRVLNACCRLEHEMLEGCGEALLYPGVCETIKALSETYKICVVSNCQEGYIELFLRKNRLEAYATDIECYGNTKKSKGENIKEIMRRNGISDAVYVGDTQGDYEASLAAGIPFVYASYGFGSPEGYTYKIKKTEELLKLF